MVNVLIYGSSSPDCKDDIIIEIQTDDEVKLSDFCKNVFCKIINQNGISFSFRVSNGSTRIVGVFNYVH